MLREGNKTVRDLLLKKGHLIPPDLMKCASLLVQHYDVWLEEFERKRLAEKPDLESPFIYAGPKGYGFPKECGTKFINKFNEMWDEAYGSG